MDALHASWCKTMESGTQMSHLSAPRPLMAELARGLLGRCPCCGKGRMFGAFLKVKDRSKVCGDELYHHRADVFPTYILSSLLGPMPLPPQLSMTTTLHPP